MTTYQPQDPYYRRWLEQGAKEHGQSLEEYLAWIDRSNPDDTLLARERRWVEWEEDVARRMGITRAELNEQLEHRRWAMIPPQVSPPRRGKDEPPATPSG